MNAPFAPVTTSVSVADLHDARELSRIADFAADMGGSLFHRPEWLLAAEAGAGQRATGIIAEKGGAIVGWLPLSEVHSPLFGRALVSSGFGVGGGVLSESDDIADRIFRMAEELATRISCPTVEVRGGHIPAHWNHRNDRHANFASELAPDDQALLLAIPRKQRAEVRKSLQSDLEISIGSAAADRSAHYAVYAESVRNLGTPVFPRTLFHAMLDRFGENADILTVRHDGVSVASVLSFYHDGAVMPFWGGGTFAARSLRANERMYYELMCHARKRGMSRFDFGRSKVGSGPYSYKKNWGFDPKPMTYGSWTAAGFEARDIDPTDEGYSAKIALWKKLPLPVANLLGPYIARGLA